MIGKALNELRPNAEWILRDGNLEWLDKVQSEPSQEEIDNKILELEQIEQANIINVAIQNHLDTKAQEFRYDNMMSARSYAGYTNQFQTEATALAQWASECWVVAGQIEADVQAGVRTMPTVDEVLAELPVYGG